MYVFIDAQRAAPTNMHNNAISVNSMHRIRFAQDLALYNLTLSEEIEGFDGTAHLTAWRRRLARAVGLTRPGSWSKMPRLPACVTESPGWQVCTSLVITSDTGALRK
jgi:hypothetical protein